MFSKCDAFIVENSILESSFYGITLYNHCDPLIKGNTISSDCLYGIECSAWCHPTITNNIITGAKTGIRCYDDCNLLVINNIIAGNKVYGFECDVNSSAKLTNNTIIDNGTYGIWTSLSPVTVVNTIVWGHKKEIFYDYSPAPTVMCCDVEGGYTGMGNIDADPLFVDPAKNDFHLSYLSPCRGAGSNGVVSEPHDFEGDPRIYEGMVDIGADEFYTHLYVTGNKTPGGAITGKFVGLPGTTPVGLFVGTDILTSPMSTMWGEFWVQAPWILLGPLGAIPAEGVMWIPATLPGSIPAPYDVPMQALIGLNPDSLSNLCVLEVR